MQKILPNIFFLIYWFVSADKFLLLIIPITLHFLDTLGWTMTMYIVSDI